MMTRRSPQDHNYHTSCPAAIKAKITALENEVFLFGAADGYSEDFKTRLMQDAQTARYNLEQTILTCIEAAVAAALEPNTERTK